MSASPAHRNNFLNRISGGLVISITGMIFLTLGANPGLFGLDFSPVVGFVQVAMVLFGLALICIGGYLALNHLWEGKEKSITADIGQRLVTTGFVVSAASGMADVFGFGSQTFPATPYFGQWQAMGIMIGQAVIILGFVLMTPFPPLRK